MKSTYVKSSEAEERWLLFDASREPLGRMAAKIARELMGKTRPTWQPNELVGAHVVVINAEKAVLTGRKAKQKEYQSYSGYPGGRRVIDFETMRARRPNDLVKLAVRRMLPKTKLGRRMLKRLRVYPGSEHRHAAQGPVPVWTDDSAR